MKTTSDKELPIVQDLKSGRFYYHFNRVEGTVEMEGEEKLQYTADTVTIEGQPTREKMIEAVIRSQYTESEEIALINNYLTYQSDNSLVDYMNEYDAYQVDRMQVKTMVNDDCIAAGIIN